MTSPNPHDLGKPVAWRVKDFADGWILYPALAEAEREAEGAGNLIEPLFTTPTSDEAGKGDVGKLVERLGRYVRARTAKPLRGIDDALHAIHAGTEWEAEITFADVREALSTIQARDEEIGRLRSRLEIDVAYQMGEDGELVAIQTPDGWPDGIECRDETIKLQEANCERLRAEIGKLRAVLAGIADNPGPNADEEAHWRADEARQALQGGGSSPKDGENQK